MVKETTVLQQRLIVRMSEDADLRVREDQAAHQIVLQIAFDRAPKRLFRQTAPGFAPRVVRVEAAPEIFLRDQRLQHRVPDIFSKDTGQAVKFLELLEFRETSG